MVSARVILPSGFRLSYLHWEEMQPPRLPTTYKATPRTLHPCQTYRQTMSVGAKWKSLKAAMNPALAKPGRTGWEK